MLAIHWLCHLSHFHLRGIPSRESESNSRSLNAKFALSKGDGNQEKIPLVCATDGRGTKKNGNIASNAMEKLAQDRGELEMKGPRLPTPSFLPGPQWLIWTALNSSSRSKLVPCSCFHLSKLSIPLLCNSMGVTPGKPRAFSK